MYGSFEDAKAFALKRREELRESWQAKTTRPMAKAAKA
jgi:hypothetical protein